MIEVDGVEYVTPREAAADLGDTYQTVRDWIRTGKIHPVKVGRANHIRFDEAAAAERATRGRGRPRSPA